MIDDMFKIVLDPFYPPLYSTKGNDFELLFCEMGSIYHNGPFNSRSPYSENIYPISSLAPPPKYYHRHAAMHHSIDQLNSSLIIEFQKKTLETELNNTEMEMNPLINPIKPKNTFIENMYNQVAHLLETVSPGEIELFIPLTNRILNMLVNWELLGDKDLKIACKALNLISQSKSCAALTETSNANIMINILDSQDTPTDIQLTTVFILNIIE